MLKQLQKNKKKKTTQKYLAKNVINEKKESSVVKLPPVDGRKIKTYFPKLRNVEGDEILKLPKFDENSSEYLTHSQIYAPDGRCFLHLYSLLKNNCLNLLFCSSKPIKK